MPVDRELRSVRRERRPDAHVGADVLRHAAGDRHGVQLAGEILRPVRREQDRFRIRRPAEHGIVGRVMRQLLRCAARDRHDIDVQVAFAIAGERNPLAIRRETRIDIARPVDGDAADVLAVLVRGPDIRQIGERHLAGVIVRVAHELGLVRGTRHGKCQQHRGSRKPRGHEAPESSVRNQHAWPPERCGLYASSTATPVHGDHSKGADVPWCQRARWRRC